MHTDLFFVFWKDIFSKDPEKKAIDTQDELDNDKQTPIHITVDEAQSDDEQATKEQLELDKTREI